MSESRFAMIGAGFWAPNQLSGWRELSDAQCVAIVDVDASRAQRLADDFCVPRVYTDAAEMLRAEQLDFVDIVTGVGSHRDLVHLAVQHGVPTICQKPLADSLAQARQMVEEALQAGIPLLVNENWRWQAPLRALHAILQSGELGSIVRARIDYANSFPVFDNQPFLKTLEQFILTDIGTHILDSARFLFGEATLLYCQTRRTRSDIAGEDVATVMLQMEDGVTVTCNMSYASHWEYDRFPQTVVAVEGTRGGVTLGVDYQLKLYGERGVITTTAPPKSYAWAHPDYMLVHASIVECQRNLLGFLRGEAVAETTAADNLRTLELVFAAYESAARATAIKVQ